MLDMVIASPDTWLWLVFIGVGLVMILLELLVGVETGLDLVFMGSAFVIAGLATWPFLSWVLTLTVTLAICLAYVALGRRYIHRWTAAKKEITNVDAIVGKKGTVLHAITPDTNGRVRVGHEEWSARADERIEAGETIIVNSVKGVTLDVEPYERGKKCN